MDGYWWAFYGCGTLEREGCDHFVLFWVMLIEGYHVQLFNDFFEAKIARWGV